jgi:hypothetical protein
VAPLTAATLAALRAGYADALPDWECPHLDVMEDDDGALVCAECGTSALLKPP